MKPIQPTRWIRYRFHSSSVDDPRPVQWPPKGPYWVSGEGDDHAVLIAYLPEGVDLTAYWPEATQKSPNRSGMKSFSPTVSHVRTGGGVRVAGKRSKLP